MLFRTVFRPYCRTGENVDCRVIGERIGIKVFRSGKPFYLSSRNLSFVDALSHALIAIIILLALGLPALIPFAVIGAVILDADIFFSLISDRSPNLYLFTHGGIAHSIAGVVVMSALAYVTIITVTITGIIPLFIPPGYGTAVFAAILASAFLHLLIDFLACPGIPLLAPVSDKKYTPGLLPGPSILLMAIAMAVLVLIISGRAPIITALTLYAVAAVLYLAVRTVFFVYAGIKIPTKRVPTINPVRWLAIDENDTACTVRHYTISRGFSGGETFRKFKNCSPGEVLPYMDMPEVRRVKFNSYVTTAEKNGSTIAFCDPLREKGYVFYPPKFRRFEIP